MEFIKDDAKQNRRIIFLHIQKTAGTTLQKIIGRQYKPDAIFPFYRFLYQESIAKLKTLPESQREKIRLFKAHYFGLHEHVSPPFTYITVLREPINRVISYYYYILETPDHHLYKELTSKSMSLKDFVCSGLTVEVENGQTSFLSGMKETGSSYERCSTISLERAKRNLQENFTVIGLTERFDETLIFLKRAFGWKSPFYINRNVTKKRLKKEDVPTETLNIIAERNQFDITLYKYAKENFDELVRRQGPSFDEELKKFKSMNRLYGKCYGTTYEILRPITTGIRRWIKAGSAVGLTIVSSSFFQSLFVLDNII